MIQPVLRFPDSKSQAAELESKGLTMVTLVENR